MESDAQYQTRHNLHSPYVIGEYYKHEIGAGMYPYKGTESDSYFVGFHVHYLYNYRMGKFGVGVGYEKLFDNLDHQSAMAMLAYRPFRHMTAILGPGITSFQVSGEQLYNFSTHLELIYEWAWRNVHFGPSIEYTYDPDFSHYSIGLHVGLGF